MQDFRANEVNDVSPSSLAHLIGQRGVIDQVAVALDAAQIDARPFPSSMLVGPPGLGKSQLAAVISQEMATDFHEVLGQSVKHVSDLFALLLVAKDRDILHFDECHELSKSMQTSLYLAIDKRRIVLGGKSSKSPQNIPIADFTLLLSTTDEYGLLQPLRDRMKLVLRFQFFSVEELTIVLSQRSRALGWTVQEELLPLIAQRSKATPRLALRLLQSCWRCCRAIGEYTITLEHLLRACDLEKIDELGLGPVEQQYLASLANGNCRLNVIASILGLPTRTIAQVIEPFLIRSGLVVKDDGGRRQLTAEGREHLSESCPKDG